MKIASSIREYLKTKRKRQEDLLYNRKVCPYCKGTRIDIDHPNNYYTQQNRACSVCNGTGFVPTN
ncbi:hypothetical protein IJM16_04785 [Candidatus Saccharibacteria bacterium]|nr:hypothetical protein [Candidatus Saccharibacteria bacterium]